MGVKGGPHDFKLYIREGGHRGMISERGGRGTGPREDRAVFEKKAKQSDDRCTTKSRVKEQDFQGRIERPPNIIQAVVKSNVCCVQEGKQVFGRFNHETERNKGQG